MDQAKIVAEGSPRDLIEQYSTKEVLELRFVPDDHEVMAEKLVELVDQIGQRLEVLPDRVLVYSHDGETTLAEVHARHVVPASSLIRRSTLEDVFLRLTGRTLVD
jgi:lipooligosaccharide transport system ATP-binding protein